MTSQAPQKTIQQLRLLLNTAPTPAMIVAGDGTIRATNAKLEVLFGYASGELIGRPIEILVPKESRVHHPSLRQAFFEVPSPRAMGTGSQLQGVSRSGERIAVEIGLHPMETEEGLRILTTVLDVRERLRHETRFRQALDAAACAILMVDEAGKIVLCNALTESVFGYPADELVGQSIEILVPPAARRKHAVYRKSYMHSPETRMMGERDRDLHGLRADGTEFPAEIALSSVEAEDGRFVICSVLDISGRRLAEKEIHDSNRHLSALNAELTAFAYSTSHDLKAPLATIQGLARCIQDDLDDGELDDVRENVLRIDRLTAKLSTLVEDVLAMTQVDKAQQASVMVPVTERIELSLQRHRQLRLDHDVEVDLSGVDACNVITQEARFDSIVDNLLSNALRYSDPDKARREVWVAASKADAQVTLTVRDNGIGIPEDMRERIFGMFERAHTSQTSGSGLGLALVRKHLEKLGGTVELTVHDGWTTFRVTVPDQAPTPNPTLIPGAT
ncbi:MAG: PAS domain S-box protein [Sandaracinaceae bacterium]